MTMLFHFFFNRTKPPWLILLLMMLTCENAKVAMSHRIVRRRGRNILASRPTSAAAPDVAKNAGRSTSRSSSPTSKSGHAQGSSSTKQSRPSNKSSLLTTGRAAARRNFDSPASVADSPSYLLLARGASSSSSKRPNKKRMEEHNEASILLQRAALRREDEGHRRVEESSRTSSYRNSRIGENTSRERVHQPPKDDSSRSAGPPMVVPIKMRCVDRVVDRILDGNINNNKKLPNGGRKLVECGLREMCNKSALTAKQCFDDGFVAFNKAKPCCCWGDGATYLCDEQMTTSTSTSTMGGTRNVIEFELQPRLQLLPGASSTASSAASSGTTATATQGSNNIADVQRGREVSGRATPPKSSPATQISGTTTEDEAENNNSSTLAQAYDGDGAAGDVAPGQEQSHDQNECPLWAIVVSGCTLVLVASLGLYLTWEGMEEQMYLMGQQAEGEEDYLGSKNMNGKKNLQHLLLQPEPEPPPQPPLGLAVARGPREDQHLQGGNSNLLSSSFHDVLLTSSEIPRAKANEITSGAARPYSNDVSSGTSYLGSVQSARFGESYASSGLLRSQKSAAGFSGAGGASTSVFQDGSSIASLGVGTNTILSGGATTSPARPAIPQVSNLPQTSDSSSSSSSSSAGRDSPRWIAARERAAAAAKAKAALRRAMSRPPVPEES